MEGLATYEYKVTKRKRGRPRKYEDLSEEERKVKRAVDNRQAAKRSYYRRIKAKYDRQKPAIELATTDTPIEDHLGALRAARPREADLSDGDVRAAD